MRGIATADVDGDGRVDFATGNQWDTSYFYRNEGRTTNRFLGLRLLLPIHPTRATVTEPGHPVQLIGRPAIGATVTVHLPDGTSRIAEVDGGNGHSGKRSPEIHFGLGSIPENTSLNVEIRWRDTTGVHHQTLKLNPGWHTVLLGASP